VHNPCTTDYIAYKRNELLTLLIVRVNGINYLYCSGGLRHKLSWKSGVLHLVLNPHAEI